MKRMTLILTLMIATITAKAMPYSEARRHALFLTDKMAYELNLTPRQYDDAYQINLDYFLGVFSPDDAYGPMWNLRNRDLHYILMDWQYSLYAAADYFFQPLLWRANSWFLPILHRYDCSHFYFSRPRAYDIYHGGGHINYVARRPPQWHGGMMGREPRGGARPDYNYRHPGNREPHHPGYNPPSTHGRPQQPGHTPPGNNGRPNHPNTEGASHRPGRTGTAQQPTTSHRPATNRNTGGHAERRGRR